jgi:hypothetical protein
MRSTLTVYPVRRVSVASVRRRSGSRSNSFAKMNNKLDAASARLARSRPRR